MQGNSQWIELKFKQSVIPARVSITFQGGFAANKVSLIGLQGKSTEAIEIIDCFPKDSNAQQDFDLPDPKRDTHSSDMSLVRPASFTRLRFLCKDSADFFGRVAIYSLDVLEKHSG